MIRTIVIPDKSHTRVTFSFPKDYIGEEVEIIAFTKKEGLAQKEIDGQLSPAIQGDPLSVKEFENWISKAESAQTISLKEAKSKWSNKRKQLQQLIK